MEMAHSMLEANHFPNEYWGEAVASKCPSNRLIAKVPMTSNRLFPLRIVLDMKGKTNMGVAFKVESEEIVELLDKRENGSDNL